MISVIISTLNGEAVLPRTLAPLITGAAEGVVKEVIFADAGSSDGTHAIADAVGAKWFEGAKQQAATNVRADWLLFLEQASVLQPGWIEAAEQAMATPDIAAAFSRGAWRDFSARISSPGSAHGLMVSRALHDRLHGAKPPRIALLAARIVST